MENKIIYKSGYSLRQFNGVNGLDKINLIRSVSRATGMCRLTEQTALTIDGIKTTVAEMVSINRTITHPELVEAVI